MTEQSPTTRPIKKRTRRTRRLRREMTYPERKLWGLLRGRRLAGLKFRRQCPIGEYIVDFYCESAGLVVELDGESHATQGDDDLDRQSALERQGFRILRVSNDDVLQDPEAVLLGIAKAAGIDIQRWLAGGSDEPSVDGD